MVQRPLERFIFLSRWLMAPFYLGLIVALAALVAKFLQELVGFAPRVLELKDTYVILAGLTLLDLSLAGSLVLMVIFSGYESFVSRLDAVEPDARLDWMGTLDFGGLKLKLIASVVAIAGVHLLKSFMNVGSMPKADLAWLVGTYAVFVVSGVLLALMDYLTALGKAVDKGKA
jgi:uncharacterized protein (TIGR00645 family)